MKLSIASRTILAIISAALVSEAFAQGPGGRPPGRRAHTANEAKPLQLIPADRKAPAKTRIEIGIEDKFRVIRSNSIPDHEVGKFPNPGNPNTIAPQDVDLKLPLKPKANAEPTPARTAVGVLLNGVYVEAGTGEFWTGQNSTSWNYEALGGAIDLGLDQNHAHVQPTGKYHYHGKPTGYLEAVNISSDKHSSLVGWAFDGFPIYALYGYSDPSDPSSRVVEMTSSYRLKSGARPKPPEGPGGHYDGAFTADYEFVAGSGTLDECNGCFTKTPEFPDGTYAYFLTNQWPVVFRNYRGTPAIRQPVRPGGRRGPGSRHENRGPRPPSR